ncbi:hypothetical protein HELRODRAFT_167677 [Helobdella robusta]|uniref:Uncharacterized protein n=1 Tax=Helobdella robusta TaxID=6412 RepID=T1EZN6_HELRO|nr:hypothetical protein HELRODRAFT_167677 [Helobdella robusta]ESO09858.1 hypothetical protein HELRODRAFT_167677 [Helobdella robusta]
MCLLYIAIHVPIDENQFIIGIQRVQPTTFNLSSIVLIGAAGDMDYDLMLGAAVCWNDMARYLSVNNLSGKNQPWVRKEDVIQKRLGLASDNIKEDFKINNTSIAEAGKLQKIEEDGGSL